MKGAPDNIFLFSSDDTLAIASFSGMLIAWRGLLPDKNGKNDLVIFPLGKLWSVIMVALSN